MGSSPTCRPSYSNRTCDCSRSYSPRSNTTSALTFQSLRHSLSPLTSYFPNLNSVHLPRRIDMKTLRLLCFVVLLTCLLTMPVMAGDTQGPSLVSSGITDTPPCANPGETSGPPCADPGDGHSPGLAAPGDVETPGLTSPGDTQGPALAIIIFALRQFWF